ncbi:MAG TPA: cob(I)yrinic acid a,c-diamide adenosyltransferase [Candidatus Latescibacteria bacterium]|nr:cob(I)yrinic acid a,c-diamide adenosyltransferase [Candidatus Latescibacterota bacterium]
MKRGLIQIYTGDGKGKTTASVGLAVRCVGHGLKVCFITFHKDPKRWGYGELEVLRKLGVEVFGFAGHPHFDRRLKPEDVRCECLEGLKFARKVMREGNYDLLILDEINISIGDGFLKEEEVLSVLDEKPEGLEVVLTGRNAPEGLVERADLVSEVRKVKHPYDEGIPGREGIEY